MERKQPKCVEIGPGPCLACADAQATIAALQARVKELEAIKIPDDAFTYCAYCGEKSPVDEHNEDLSAHIKVCPKHPIRDVEAQLTQRTAERDTARRRVDELEAREVDVVLLREDLEKRTAELEAVKADTKNMLDVATSRLREQVADLQAELERVRGELVETKEVEAALSSKVAEYEVELNGDPQNFYGGGRTVGLRTLIAALPKVEGEISERFCTGSYYSSPYDYRSHVTFETALVALLKHRQGMEG